MASNPVTREVDFDFIQTPKPFTTKIQAQNYGVRTTNVWESLILDDLPTNPKRQVPSIANAPLPADASGSDSFSNIVLFGSMAAVPYYLSWKLGGGLKTAIFLAIFTSIPILVINWHLFSRLGQRKNEKATFPNRGVEYYLTFKKEADRAKYVGRNKIPMWTFFEMYFDGDVEFNGDCLEMLEYRHDWASFGFTMGLYKFFLTGMIPEVIMHTRSQGMSLSPCNGSV